MTLFSENSEKDYISISRFIENFQANTNKELAIKDIIKLLTNQKIRFFVYVTGDQNEIKLSKRERAKSFPNNLYNLDIDYTEDEIRYCYSSDSNKSFYDYSCFKEARNQRFIKKTSSISLHSMIDKTADDITCADFGWYKKVNVLDRSIDFSGFFELNTDYEFSDEIRVTFEVLIEENKEYPLMAYNLFNYDTGFCITHKFVDENSISNLEINYLQDLYLSKIDIEILTHDLNLLKPLDLTPQNNEIEELKKELEKLKERNKTLNLENRRLERELDKLKNGELLNSDKHYQNLIIGLAYQFHPDYKARGYKFFTEEDKKISRNGIVDAVMDTLEKLSSKGIFTEKIYRKSTLDGKLKSLFEVLKE